VLHILIIERDCSSKTRRQKNNGKKRNRGNKALDTMTESVSRSRASEGERVRRLRFVARLRPSDQSGYMRVERAWGEGAAIDPMNEALAAPHEQQPRGTDSTGNAAAAAADSTALRERARRRRAHSEGSVPRRLRRERAAGRLPSGPPSHTAFARAPPAAVVGDDDGAGLCFLSVPVELLGLD